MKRVLTQMTEYLKYLKHSYRYFIVLMTIVVLTGCSSSVQKDDGQTELKVDYTAEQMIIIAASQKADISRVYGEGIWTATLSDTISYSDMFYDDMENFAKKMYIADRYAEEHDIKLESKDSNTIEKATDILMDSIGTASGSVKNAARSDVSRMYEQYVLSSKVMNSLASEDMVEVSDSEARVMTVGVIVTDDIDQAAAAHDELAQGSSFNQVAKKYSQDATIERQIMYTDLPEVVAKAAYELEDGNYTDVIEDSGRCYIIECINSYEEEATAANKIILQKKRTLELIDSKFNTYAAKYDVTIDKNTWAKVTKDDSVIKDKGFFDCLKEVE